MLNQTLFYSLSDKENFLSSLTEPKANNKIIDKHKATHCSYCNSDKFVKNGKQKIIKDIYVKLVIKLLQTQIKPFYLIQKKI